MGDVNVTPVDVNRGAGANFTDSKTAATAGNNYLIPNDGRTLLLANSSGGGTVTVLKPNAVDGDAISGKALTATAGKTIAFGPFPPGVYNDANGKMTVQVSANTDIMAVRGVA